jgi:photosystem II stability/assembly factor-like uncharacterized protein
LRAHASGINLFPDSQLALETPMSRNGVLRFKTLRIIGLVGLAFASAAWLREPDANAPPLAADNWTLVLDRPGNGKYEDFAFPDATHGWLASVRGDILHTTDGGSTWAVQASGMGSLRSIDFLDRKRGFAGTLSGKLYATNDGGATWTDITSTLPHRAKGFCGITHVGDQVHIVGRYNMAATDYFFSPDAGKTWRYTNLGDVAQGLVDVSFLSKDVGFIGGMGKSAEQGQSSAIILKTTDGGKHWRTVFEHSGGRGFAWKIFPITSKMIYASLQSQDGIYRVAKTLDGGDHWDTLTVATGRRQGPGVQGIGFLDANRGWVGGFFQGMWATTDGGKTWSEVTIPDGLINRFEKIGNTLITAGTRGILRHEERVAEHR